MYMILWRFRPRPDCIAEFEAAYGPNGDWARLFAQAEGYLGTELWKRREGADDYLTIDRWQTEQKYWLFRQRFHGPYSALDLKLQSLTDEEELLGQFDAI
jgi:heme-degrading monooxygenase HmoA